MKKSGFIDSVRVGSPCGEDWNAMSGNAEIRFCSHCSKNVNNLSAMTRREAKKLVAASGANLCVRYVSNPLTGAPVFADQFVQIARRASRLAAGVMSATITMSTLTFAQGGMARRDPKPESPASAVASRASISSSDGSISGTVTDPQGAVVPGATVRLLDQGGNLVRSLTSTDDGSFRFDNVLDGTYKVEVSASGFKMLLVENISANGSGTDLHNVSMELSLDVVVLSGVVAIAVEYEGEIAAAVFGDDIEAVSDLIARGENVNRREEDRTTPLFIAVENGNLDMVRLLLAHGAKVNARNKARQTPIMRLDEDASVELVELLLAHGAKADVSDDDGYTPLMMAAAGAKAAVVRALLSAGSKINSQNKEGMTALMMAADRDDVEVVKALLASGADVKLKDNEGETARDKTGDTEIEDLLVAHGHVVPQEETEPEQPSLPPPPDNK